MKHGIGAGKNADFGITNPTNNNVQLYLVQRAATFFQAVNNGKVASDFGTTKFVNCENFRKTCSTADDHEPCP